MKKYVFIIFVMICVVAVTAHLISVGQRINNPYAEIERLNTVKSENLWPSLVMPDYALSSAEGRDTETYDVQIGEQQFRFPIRYIRGNPSVSQRDGTSLLLYILPDFRSRLDIKGTEEYERARKGGHFGQMLLRNGTGVEFEESLEVQRNSRNNHYANLEIIPFEGPGGLKAEHWYRNYINGPKAGTREIETDRFFEINEDGSIRSHISCNPEANRGEREFPQCKHFFVHNGVQVVLSYSRQRYLVDWSEVRKSAAKFIEFHKI